MDLQDLPELTNFFERRVAAYQTAVTGQVTFDEAFSSLLLNSPEIVANRIGLTKSTMWVTIDVATGSPLEAAILNFARFQMP